MFDFLKTKNSEQPLDVKTTRHRLVQFIKERLQRWEGGEGGHIKGLQLFFSPATEERELYESAVYLSEEGRFRSEEIQKIADDFAIELPQNWFLEIYFTEELPAEAARIPDLPAGLHLVTSKKPTINRPTTGYIRVLGGEAEQSSYTITAAGGKVCIGRDREAQTGGGFYRLNAIAFPGTSTNPANKFISRQHAHIEWNAETGSFLLFADEGGIPPRNKVKVQTSTGDLIKLQTTEIGHPLQEGDQIVLGETALIQFSYTANK